MKKNKELLCDIYKLHKFISRWLYRSYCKRSYILNHEEIAIVADLINSLIRELQEREKRSLQYAEEKKKK